MHQLHFRRSAPLPLRANVMGGTYLLCALIIVISSCSSAPPATETVGVSATAPIDRNQPGAGVISVEGDLTEAAPVGGEILLTLAVTNAGSRDIQQLTVIVNLAYVSRMIVLETKPNAIRHSEQGGEYFIFGPLAAGRTENYVIRMSPLQAGQFDATIDVAELSPIDMTPLLSKRGGVAEFTAQTDVVEP